jgi:hypothetical protein
MKKLIVWNWFVSHSVLWFYFILSLPFFSRVYWKKLKLKAKIRSVRISNHSFEFILICFLNSKNHRKSYSSWTRRCFTSCSINHKNSMNTLNSFPNNSLVFVFRLLQLKLLLLMMMKKMMMMMMMMMMMKLIK